MHTIKDTYSYDSACNYKVEELANARMFTISGW